MRLPVASAIRRLLYCLTAAFSLAAATRLDAQQTDVIRGKVTTTEGLPLQNVRVTATSIPGNVTRETRSNNQGSFQIAFPGGTGDYIMGYALIGYNFRQFEIKRVADEDVLIADARLSVVQLDTVVVSASNQQRVNRNQPTPDVSGTERPISLANLPPELIGDIAAMAASLPGVTLIPGLDGAPDGFSVLGLGADQNSVTLNGMQGGPNNLPRDAAVSSSLTTSPYDGSRGGFSGGNFNIRSSPGSNFKTRGMSLNFNSPALEWTDRGAEAVGTKFTKMSFSGVTGGPIKFNKMFYNISGQFDRTLNNNFSLLNTSRLGLATYGVAMDSVNRLRNILGSRSVPLTIASVGDDRATDNASVFGNIDFSPPNSSSGHSFGITFNGNWGRQRPINAFGTAALQSAASSGDRTNWSGGIQGRHSGYFGLFLSESQIGVNTSRNYGDPYLDLPQGRVSVTSEFEGVPGSIQNLTFGGNQGLSSSSRTINSSFQNTLSWFDDRNKHRIKLGTELGFSGNSQDQSANRLGTFTFNSLADLEAGHASSFTRTLTTRPRSTGQLNGAMSITDSYRRNPDLQIQYSLRVDASHFTATPEFNPNVERAFGKRNDHIPTPISFSPRIGFSQTLGKSNEISAFTGAFQAPRAVWRGGIAVLTNAANSGLIGAALDNTGLPSGTQQINCVGPAVPIPNWAAYAADLSSVPTACADGTAGTLFANPSPNVTLVSKDYTTPKTVRANTSWNGSILDARFNFNVDATYSLNLNQQRFVDINFQPATRFTLADDGRPVFVQLTSIVPTTGSVASRDARVSQDFSRVSEIRSDLQSRTAQISLRLNPIFRTPSRFGWNLAYTYQHTREQVSGFSSTAGNPLDLTWANSALGPHSVNYGLRYTFFNAITVNWNGMFRSGNAYTPVILGDVNGDGSFNDRAFVFAPSTSDPTGLGMQQLLASASPGARECLEKQIGHIAERNSCRAPWSSSASLGVTLDRARFRMPHRANVSFSLSNPLGAADLAVNRSGHLRGWGQSINPEATLLRVRGFDPASKRYTYEVNQRFGATRSDLVVLSNPVLLTTAIKYDLGAMRERQSLMQQLGFGRTLPGSRYPEQILRQISGGTVTNPMVSILRQQDSLKLTSLQADSIASMNRRYNYRTDSLWAPVARYLAKLPERFDEGDAYDRFQVARQAQLDLLERMAPLVHELLTPEQRRKLPALVVNMMDPRYLASIRHGTSLYAGGGPIGFGGIGMPVAMMMEAGVAVIH